MSCSKRRSESVIHSPRCAPSEDSREVSRTYYHRKKAIRLWNLSWGCTVLVGKKNLCRLWYSSWPAPRSWSKQRCLVERDNSWAPVPTSSLEEIIGCRGNTCTCAPIPSSRFHNSKNVHFLRKQKGHLTINLLRLSYWGFNLAHTILQQKQELDSSGNFGSDLPES